MIRNTLLSSLAGPALLLIATAASALARDAELSPEESGGGAITIERVTTKVPFPRGLQLVDGELYVLARGRVRGSGGVSAEVEDQAGTIYAVDPNVVEPATG